jgi:hypothetical protein
MILTGIQHDEYSTEIDYAIVRSEKEIYRNGREADKKRIGHVKASELAQSRRFRLKSMSSG